eukprot:CAMPEP_0173120972 /NCGR_PEP_ID=MMETSP1102-20130122/52929_1 /TAXON_ID=49646 /ORGANISM="Geminigera sp., Strain Caron Lab Isolate" /LENGTH=36 /DNA_ID= /DNA_START= /DNA_END= /DNA_ORIENTATION=
MPTLVIVKFPEASHSAVSANPPLPCTIRSVLSDADA